MVMVMCLMCVLYLQTDRSPEAQDAPQRDASNMASAYVPIESWVYPAFEKLASEGYLQSALFDLRPWTRMECARFIEDSDDQIENASATPEVLRLLHNLREEFAVELRRRGGERNVELRIQSLDQRVTSITGTPLTDGYHFAETVVNDDGRPFAAGANIYTGGAFRAAAGPFAAYARVEMQRAPAAPVPSLQAQEEIAAADFTPAAAAGPSSNFLRGWLIEGYVSFAFFNNQFTFGRQSLWWGPAKSGTTLFSNNAEPITMLRYDRVRPFELPGFLKTLGPIRVQLLLGRLAGAQYIQASPTAFGMPGVALSDQPFIHGEKISFRPTPNFEFGVSRTVLFGGQGAPVTASTFFHSVFSASTENGGNDPGDRRQAVDAEYRIPGLRRCLTVYFDGFADDQPFPLAYPTESTWISGATLSCIPRAPHLTLRAEGLISPHRNPEFPGFFYFNVHYLSGYTNDRQLIGSWIGREGHGEQLWATWQLSPRSSVELSGRNMTVDQRFLQGGVLHDLRVHANLSLRPEWQLELEEQAEWWRFPLLSAQPQHNAEFTIQLSYTPIGRAK
jgi:Capsule assembly protein Wzi